MVDVVNRLLCSADSVACLRADHDQEQPAAVLCVWGEGATWQEIRTIWLWAMVAYKLGVAMMLFVVIWLTLWARKLAKK
jgi:hypothetical protein